MVNYSFHGDDYDCDRIHGDYVVYDHVLDIDYVHDDYDHDDDYDDYGYGHVDGDYSGPHGRDHDHDHHILPSFLLNLIFFKLFNNNIINKRSFKGIYTF
jgi:hypothetical protein